MGWVRRLLSQWEPPSRSGVPPQRLTMGPVKNNQTNSGSAEKLSPPLRGVSSLSSCFGHPYPRKWYP